MSLKKKIVLSFFISAFTIAILAGFVYVNFVEIRREIRYLEIADTVRSKSLQLRRHEKNFFLFGPLSDESQSIYRYLDELDAIVKSGRGGRRESKLSLLGDRVNEYRTRFRKIESMVRSLSGEFKQLRASFRGNRLFPLVELTFFERPLQTAEVLEGILHPSHGLPSELRGLDLEISALRKSGEDILALSKDLDKAARENAEHTIYLSQIAILVVLPLFFISGIGTLFFISRDVVNRLRLLIEVVEKTGKGSFPQVVVPPHKWGGNDEIGVLIHKVNEMEGTLAQREEELERKNRELLQSKKLAAIGTLASGVAHELNNPLNNIYISAQVLKRESGEHCPPMIKETVEDIVSQAIRVKRIVGNLLMFARGREPQLRTVELNGLVQMVWKNLNPSYDPQAIGGEKDIPARRDVQFVLASNPAGVNVQADPEQLERVFINLFSNALDAMPEGGTLTVKVEQRKDSVRMAVSDTGRGIPAEVAEKVFEPFFTTKDKGTGLGLAIVFNIIKKHDGEITIESNEGKGTTFAITLPRGPR
ncbi:MAG TPA: ATP-binding protein [Dissulfurispiraceae bacterium]